jgi:hypothetical protein
VKYKLWTKIVNLCGQNNLSGFSFAFGIPHIISLDEEKAAKEKAKEDLKKIVQRANEEIGKVWEAATEQKTKDAVKKPQEIIKKFGEKCEKQLSGDVDQDKDKNGNISYTKFGFGFF